MVIINLHMTHPDHIELLKKAITKKGGIWADLGSGEGAFTLALRELVGPDAYIYSVDHDQKALDNQKVRFEEMFPRSTVNFCQADFTKPIILRRLDGVVMANSLHFVKDQLAVLQQVRKYLHHGGKLILVEYNADEASSWVPYPVSFKTFGELTIKAGFTKPQFLARIPSDFMNQIYSASTIKTQFVL